MPFVECHMAAAALSLCLQYSAASCKMVTPTSGNSYNFKLGECQTVPDLAELIAEFSEVNSSSAQIFNILQNELEDPVGVTDLYVVIGRVVNHKPLLSLAEKHGNERPKFVFTSLFGRRPGCFVERPNILVTSGFDDKVLSIISAFSVSN